MAAEQHLKSVGPASVLRQVTSRAAIWVRGFAEFVLAVRAFYEIMDGTGSHRDLQMLAKEDSNLLERAALPSQLSNYFGVLFELRTRLPFGDLVEQFANSLIHRKHLSGRRDLRREAARTRIQLERVTKFNRNAIRL